MNAGTVLPWVQVGATIFAALAAGIVAWRSGAWKDAALQAKDAVVQAKDAEIALLKELTYEKARDLLKALKELHLAEMEAVQREHQDRMRALQEAGLTPEQRAELEAQIAQLALTANRLREMNIRLQVEDWEGDRWEAAHSETPLHVEMTPEVEKAPVVMDLMEAIRLSVEASRRASKRPRRAT
jgi:hypothetical protein